MILPKGGKILVFDDKPEDVQFLLDALKINGAPYLYFKEESGVDLPSETINGVRLVFLDLQLFTDRSSEKDIISSIAQRLTRTLNPKESYILIYWSKTEDQYKKALEDEFDKNLNDYKPIVSFSLEKSTVPKDDEKKAIEFILNKMEENVSKFDSLAAFLWWENMVNDSTNELVLNFTNFVDKDENWNNHLKHVLYKLAHANSGKQVDQANYSNSQKINDSLRTLNQTLVDSIEKNIDNQIHLLNEKEYTIKDDQAPDHFLAKINTKLLITEGKFVGTIPGTLFFLYDELDQRLTEAQTKYNVQDVENRNMPDDKKKIAIQSTKKKLKEKTNSIDSQKESISSDYRSILTDNLKPESRDRKDDILKNSIFVELNISPLCDYAQNKLPCVRILPGLFIEKNESQNLKKPAYSYIHDSPIEFNSKEYIVLFDFRWLYSNRLSKLKQRNSNYKLKHQFLSDIQLKLGSHISRAGVYYVAP